MLDSLVPLIPGHFAHCVQMILVILSPHWQQAQEDDNCVFITSSEWSHVTPSSYMYSVELQMLNSAILFTIMKNWAPPNYPHIGNAK